MMIYALSLIVPAYVAIILGISAGILISSLYFDKVERLLK
jgi:hypothetical protein